jgi:aquaporin Z
VLGVAFAFGLTVLTMAFAIGHISGCHLNPAVSFGLVVGGRFPAKELLPYVIAQVIGAILAAGVIYSSPVARPASSCLGVASTATPTIRRRLHAGAGFVSEVVMTAMFLVVIMGATDARAPAGFAPIAIGLALTLIHLISIPVTNTSVNPARSTGRPCSSVAGPCSSCGCSGWRR